MNEEVSLESSASESQSIVDALDPSTGKLRINVQGPFWKAVDRAHALGFSGRGRTVAIIDTMCDVSIPCLAERIDSVWPDLDVSGTAKKFFSHGTAVALLISCIAPDSRLDIYPVSTGEALPQRRRVVRAIEAAAASNASVINLSLGIAREFHRHRHIERNPGVEELFDDPHRWLASVSPDVEDCVLCPAATAAGKAKLVFAAAGNDPRMVNCPARAEGIVAVGFQRSSRETITLPDGRMIENASATGTGAQSAAWDIALEEFSSILGTSFASPLYAGVGALGITAAELQGYLASTRRGGLAQTLQKILRSGAGSADMVADTRALFEQSLRCLPHAHCSVNARLRPELPLTDPKSCWSCGIFAEDKFVNAGLFFAESGQLDEGIALLTAACDFAPWSDNAFANLGAIFRFACNLREAARCYERAVELRPGYPMYTKMLAEIRGQLSH